MNAPLRAVAFERIVEDRLVRPEHLRAAARPAGDRFAGIAITLAAHIAAVAALVLGFHVVKPLLAPQTITVSVVQKQDKPVKLDVVMPKFVPPPETSAPAPMFDIAPSPTAITATPPKATPVLAPQSPGPVRDTGESRATYLGLLLAQLNRFKHYPPEARSAHVEGVVMLHFIVDRNGKVLSAEIAKPSGRAALDREALALIDRAQPLPAMPASMTGDTLDAIVPVNFSLHG